MYAVENPFPLDSDLTASKACCVCGGGKGCNDKTLSSGVPWHDSSGPAYNCTWYAEGSRCADFGSNPKLKNEFTGREACCACAGGDDPFASISSTPATTEQCYDRAAASGEAWSDSGGFDCEWYAFVADRCLDHGSKWLQDGLVGNDACCACGGGSDSPPEPSKCVDLLLDGEAWNDDGGATYNCDWYGGELERCTNDGNNYRNIYTANEACCACGRGNDGGDGGDGGDDVNTSTPSPAATCKDKSLNGGLWNDGTGADYNCSWYAIGTHCETEGDMYNNTYTANEACCACKSGCTDIKLANGDDWHDDFGAAYNCAWYAEEADNCVNYGGEAPFEGITANDACCTCKN